MCVCVCVYAAGLLLSTPGLRSPKGIGHHHSHHLHNGDKINLLSPPFSLCLLLSTHFITSSPSHPLPLTVSTSRAHVLCLAIFSLFSFSPSVFVSILCYNRPCSSLQPLSVASLCTRQWSEKLLDMCLLPWKHLYKTGLHLSFFLIGIAPCFHTSIFPLVAASVNCIMVAQCKKK